MANFYAQNSLNRARLRRQLRVASQFPDEVAEAAMPIIGEDLVKEVKESLVGPGQGRTYVLRNPSRVHQASKPFDPPATDLGRLIGSYNLLPHHEEAAQLRRGRKPRRVRAVLGVRDASHAAPTPSSTGGGAHGGEDPGNPPRGRAGEGHPAEDRPMSLYSDLVTALKTIAAFGDRVGLDSVAENETFPYVTFAPEIDAAGRVGRRRARARLAADLPGRHVEEAANESLALRDAVLATLDGLQVTKPALRFRVQSWVRVPDPDPGVVHRAFTVGIVQLV